MALMLGSHRGRRRTGGFAVPSMWRDALQDGVEVLVVSSPLGVSFMPLRGRLKIKRPQLARLARTRVADGILPIPDGWLARSGLAAAAFLVGQGMTGKIVAAHAWRRSPHRPPLSCR